MFPVMLLVRPAAEGDVRALAALARTIEGGLTSVPAEEQMLRERVESSMAALGRRVSRPGAEYYVFVLEDLNTGELVGSSAVAARVGGFDPFYSYEIHHERFTHPPLGVDKTMTVLHLKQVHDGPSELAGLCLRPDRRGMGLGRLLSLSRFLFMAAFPERFTNGVIAELRGFVDGDGRSPFWEAVGRIFFEHDFYTADRLSGTAKQFIADLMPQHPIYVSLLPAAVQAVIGRVHRDSQQALALLKAEGFAETAEVDIFDAGPQVRAQLSQIRTVRERTQAVVSDLCGEGHDDETPLLVARPTLDFRCALGTVQRLPGDTVALTPSLAAALRVGTGDQVTFAARP